jgi:serine/threonine protein kinase
MIANKYVPEKEIKRGSFGIVLKGKDKKGEPVAIKIEYGKMDSLKHEVKMINYLYNYGVRKIPSIYWYGKHNEHPCLVLSYYECSLSDYIQNRAMTVLLANRKMVKMISIMENIHKYFVVHRDIKPQNFMTNNGELYLIDFGLATFYVDENSNHCENSQTDTIIGTPNFVSIHIHNGNKYSRRDDMISIGYLYMYVLFGKCPWSREKEQNVGVLNEQRGNYTSVHIHHPMNLYLKSQKEYDKIIHYGIDVEHINFYLKLMYDLDYHQPPNYELAKQYFPT